MKYRIPKRFKLCNIPIDVIKDPRFGEEHGCAGQAFYSEQKIILDSGMLPKESMEQACLHEQTHWILFLMNRHDLRNDEAFVDTFAHLLYQMIESAEYEEEDNEEGTN